MDQCLDQHLRAPATLPNDAADLANAIDRYDPILMPM
jgi:hypothetical protein